MSGYYRLPTGHVAALAEHDAFPPLHHALSEPNGLIAIGGDLTAQRLLAAYRQGIFPWFSVGDPILWWSPDPRMVLFPQAFILPRSLAKRLKRHDYEVRFDSAFRDVIEACAAAPRADQDSTWIVPEMVEAYCRLHELGYAHSAECWMEGELVGGLYGVQLGRVFYGESMFHRRDDASKIAFVRWVQHLQAEGCRMIDCQMKTHHLQRFGAREIARAEFTARLAEWTAA